LHQKDLIGSTRTERHAIIMKTWKRSEVCWRVPGKTCMGCPI